MSGLIKEARSNEQEEARRRKASRMKCTMSNEWVAMKDQARRRR